MTVHRLPVMTAWRRVYRTESVMTMSLIGAFASAYEASKPMSEDLSTRAIFIAFALSDLASAYLALNDWLAGGDLRVDAIEKFDKAPVPNACGVGWIDVSRRALLERREAAGWLMRYALQECQRVPLEEQA